MATASAALLGRKYAHAGQTYQNDKIVEFFWQRVWRKLRLSIQQRDRAKLCYLFCLVCFWPTRLSIPVSKIVSTNCACQNSPPQQSEGCRQIGLPKTSDESPKLKCEPPDWFASEWTRKRNEALGRATRDSLETGNHIAIQNMTNTKP
ncbi:hypothetical protein LH452_12895 [Laribacter hongkongensis]|uniref:hypothetical protein n=1 Tax=Laribacter hongkongensis TaxID=168471 RepID=UPI001EFE6913|nr:hypothetical protein [Laribacter hongkongensis]MCG9059803.1 hypothetical protein [Laribacter hongkongensis]MCG9086543.1 hypothetical protein [Laribacter hongkongensis]